MKSVEIRLPTRDLSDGLASMREWLDQRGFQPSVFRYDAHADGSEAVVHVTFKTHREAAEFAAALGGVVVASGT
jgi:hypothetical protein